MKLQDLAKIFMITMCTTMLFSGCSTTDTDSASGRGASTVDDGMDDVVAGDENMPLGDSKLGTPETERPGGKVQSKWEPIHFDYNSASIRKDDRSNLEEIAKWAKENRSSKVMVAGHCDERGTSGYNLSLGQRRANAARAYLIKLGVPAKNIATISYGEERPIDPGHNDDAWAKNRRDEFGMIQ